ncbi:MAG: hypothetical protein HYU66_12695 [Armatimonadetes bacterium]|nr:hypothetical protein [Armatimonadota bacterium]
MPDGAAQAEALSAVVNLVTVVVLALPVGLALVRVFGMYFVDQSISTAEAGILVLAVVTVLGLTAVMPVLWLRPIPPLIGLAGWILAARAIHRRETVVHQKHLESEERKAQLMLTRDPNATVAYERLYHIRVEQGRLDEAREALLAWQKHNPRDPAAMRFLRRLDAEMGRAAPGDPAVPVRHEPEPVLPSLPEPPPSLPPPTVAPVGLAADLDAFAATPEPAPEPAPPPVEAPPPVQRTAEERELEAFAPPDETPDDRPAFGPAEEPEQPPTGVLGAVPDGRVDHRLVDEDPLAPAYPEKGEEEPAFHSDLPDPGSAARPEREDRSVDDTG